MEYPHRLLVDGADILIDAYEGLFSRVYAQVSSMADLKDHTSFQGKGGPLL